MTTARRMATNGPAVGFSKRYPKKPPGHLLIYFSRETVTVARRVRRGFCIWDTSFSRRYACRGTSMIGARKLSWCRIFVAGTGAVSRYKFDRSQETVTMQDLNCGQVRVSGCRFFQDLSWEQDLQKP